MLAFWLTRPVHHPVAQEDKGLVMPKRRSTAADSSSVIRGKGPQLLDDPPTEFALVAREVGIDSESSRTVSVVWRRGVRGGLEEISHSCFELDS